MIKKGKAFRMYLAELINALHFDVIILDVNLLAFGRRRVEPFPNDSVGGIRTRRFGIENDPHRSRGEL